MRLSRRYVALLALAVAASLPGPPVLAQGCPQGYVLCGSSTCCPA